jgi:hypothetical protein
MARLTLNVDQETFDSAGRSFEPVPVGRYKVSIFSIVNDEVKSGDNKGKPRLKFQFRIADGEVDSNGTNQANRRLFADVNAFNGTSKEGKPTSPFELVAIGKAVGVSAEEFADADTDDWLGEELQVTVKWTPKQRKDEKLGKWVDIEPTEYKEKVGGFRSLESVATSAAATARVTGGAAKAATGAKAGVAPKAAGAAKKPLIKL